MSEIKLMQELLNKVLENINELEGEIKFNLENPVELKSLKKELMTQIRMKITLIRSIEELSPSNNVITVYRPLKPSIFSRIKSFFRINRN